MSFLSLTGLLGLLGFLAASVLSLVFYLLCSIALIFLVMKDSIGNKAIRLKDGEEHLELFNKYRGHKIGFYDHDLSAPNLPPRYFEDTLFSIDAKTQNYITAGGHILSWHCHYLPNMLVDKNPKAR